MRNWRIAILATAGICFLLLSTAGEGLALNWGSKEVETEKVAVKLTREVLKGGYGIVTTDELKQWLDQGKQPLIIDTMPYKDSFAKEHIPGAVHFEFPIEEVAQLDAQTREEYVKLLGTDKDRLLVIYCGFTKCDSATPTSSVTLAVSRPGSRLAIPLPRCVDSSRTVPVVQIKSPAACRGAFDFLPGLNSPSAQGTDPQRPGLARRGDTA